MLVYNFCPRSMWLPGVIVKVHGPVTYSMKQDNGITVNQHVDHLREHITSAEVPGVTEPLPLVLMADSDSADATAPDHLPSMGKVPLDQEWHQVGPSLSFRMLLSTTQPLGFLTD